MPLPTEDEKIMDALVALDKRVRNLETEIILPGQTRFLRTAAQNIANNSDTPISWDTLDAGSGFTWSISDPTKVRLASSRAGVRIFLGGRIQWAANGTGRRQCSVNIYTASDVLRETMVLHNLACQATGSTVIPVSYFYTLVDPTDYFIFSVLQTSTAALNLERANVGLILVR